MASLWSIQSRKCAFVDMRPGFLSPSAGLKFADIPNGLAAVSKVPVAGWAQIAAYFGFVEFSGGFEDYKTGTPGDYGFKVLTSSDPEEKTKKLSAELANGRLAMMAIIGMFFQVPWAHGSMLLMLLAELKGGEDKQHVTDTKPDRLPSLSLTWQLTQGTPQEESHLPSTGPQALCLLEGG